MQTRLRRIGAKHEETGIKMVLLVKLMRKSCAFIRSYFANFENQSFSHVLNVSTRSNPFSVQAYPQKYYCYNYRLQIPTTFIQFIHH